jgi:hypothetical protein
MTKPLVQFVSIIPGLDEIEECRPKPTNKYIPQWWKDMPLDAFHQSHIIPAMETVKGCPSFPDFFSQGFVIPAWCDILLNYDKKTEQWSTKSGRKDGGNQFMVESHPKEQFLRFVDAKFMGDKQYFTFKFVCPWQVITPKGYSVLQLPMFYHYSNEFTVMPGIIDTSVHHEINQQVAFTSDKDEVFIPRGTPIAQYIPFKNTKYDIEIRYQTEQDEKLFAKNHHKLISKFTNGYRHMRKEAEGK